MSNHDSQTVQTSKRTTKLYIPIPHADHNVVLCGVLEQLAPGEATQGRKIALILHGTMGHKDYLFQKRLALRLPIDSFRFDFRGNHESTGNFGFGGFNTDVEDLTAVVAYLTSQFGYTIDLLVGHSRGVVDAFRWICTAEEGKNVRGFVNVSGRYRMQKIYDGVSQAQHEALKTQGYYIVKAVVARKHFENKVTEADLEQFATFDSSLVWDSFPSGTHALSIHGLQDHVVPPFDASIYARALGARDPGTHNLCYVEEADHNFTGMADFVVATILDWFTQMERGQLKTGVWQTGIRGKL
ncbi:Alpha/Beta hydrolase protein [Cristinia sonorae]|uniref:Alpha/Beta hydrolase protein n=1 Tax=Cristinia sonorae TaxID=1940300 RepID=A0A8K0UU74_9AGAR|nr:Alpha/Beta hydrolase protein [Cristinia sonorae]